ncbi:hypothetical protein ACJ41O_009691 [Fusarium nematophilum]
MQSTHPDGSWELDRNFGFRAPVPGRAFGDIPPMPYGQQRECHPQRPPAHAAAQPSTSQTFEIQRRDGVWVRITCQIDTHHPVTRINGLAARLLDPVNIARFPPIGHDATVMTPQGLITPERWADISIRSVGRFPQFDQLDTEAAIINHTDETEAVITVGQRLWDIISEQAHLSFVGVGGALRL